MPWLSMNMTLWSSAEQRWAREQATRLWIAFSLMRIKYNKWFNTYSNKKGITNYKNFFLVLKSTFTRPWIFSSSLFNVLATQSFVAYNTIVIFLWSYKIWRSIILIRQKWSKSNTWTMNSPSCSFWTPPTLIKSTTLSCRSS